MKSSTTETENGDGDGRENSLEMRIVDPNTCVRGCCTSSSIPLHLPPSSYSLLAPIAKGAESVVYLGTLSGKKVAVKKPVISTSEDLNKFHNELQLLCKVDRPGIAKLVAAHAKPPNYMFFFEYYENGNLSGKLHDDEWTPSVGKVVTLARNLAKALSYLHENGIIHRDVKPANILLDEYFDGHLSDFGLAEYKKNLSNVSSENWKYSGKPTGGFHKKNMVGTLIYMAPEILKKDSHSEKSDVYSFGITINELLTCVVPYTDLRAAAQAHTVLEMNYTEQQLTSAVVSTKLRPALAKNAPETITKLIQRCWDHDPLKRPSFIDILSELDSSYPPEENHNPNNLPQPTSSDRHSFKESINWFAKGEACSPSGTNPDLSNWLHSSEPTDYLPVVTCGSFATRGQREFMEDTHFVLPRFSHHSEIHLFGIFDGHRGAAAAEFSAKAMPRFLQSLANKCSLSEALRESFLLTDSSLRNVLECSRNPRKISHPGCTASVCLIAGDKLLLANAGDCRAILCRGGRPLQLSHDHVASSENERARVVAAGGQVHRSVDTWRVGDVALQVTRSIGDEDLKPAVTAEPEITERVISEEDEYVVMGSDGIWDVMSNEEVVRIVKETVKDAALSAKRLVSEAAQKGSGDNITVIVVFLRPVTTVERIY